jgi:uncharacterized membrane protein HdeD (DUF308 family)
LKSIRQNGQLLLQAIAALLAVLVFGEVLPASRAMWTVLGVLALLAYVVWPPAPSERRHRDARVIAVGFLALMLTSTLTFALVAWQSSAARAINASLAVGLLSGSIVELAARYRRRS